MKVAVLGSINLDLVATGAALPGPGETVTGAVLGRHPGGKGANQALAARRLGAEVALFGRVGRDAMAAEALALLSAEGVDLSGVVVDPDRATGVALIAVSEGGENQISVCSGANAAVATPQRIEADALILQLEVPVASVVAAALAFGGFVAVNLAPAVPVPVALLERADLLVVNETEAEFYGADLFLSRGMVALTLGSQGAELWCRGERLARATPPLIDVIDTTGAGDVFMAALTLGLVEGHEPEEALTSACVAGALATTCPGAQPSAPTRRAVEQMRGAQA